MNIEKIDAYLRKVVMFKNWDIQATAIIFILIHFVSFLVITCNTKIGVTNMKKVQKFFQIWNLETDFLQG